VLVRTLRAGCDRFGFRLVEYSVVTNHFHLIVEVPDQRALTREAKGLFVRLAKQLNKLWGRKGCVFPERYYARALETPRQVRRALVYVLHNARRHRCWGAGIDPFSSGAWFDGYRAGPDRLPAVVASPIPAGRGPTLVVIFGIVAVELLRAWPRPTRRARTWLLAAGWLRHGRIDPNEAPLSWFASRPELAMETV
jgi:hypothetical protein